MSSSEQTRQRTPAPLRLATWNVEWARSRSDRGRSVRAAIDGVGELVVLTECDVDLLGGMHLAEGGSDWGYRVPHAGRRKVAMGSAQPWTDVDAVGSDDLPPGRFVAATTDTPLGPLRVVGVCIPWSGAHVTGGQKDRRRWEDHERYLEALGAVLEAQPRPLVVAGDFNQRIPAVRQPRRVAEQLGAVLDGFEIPTAGPTEEGALIDHVAVSKELTGRLEEILPARTQGRKLSDHHGAVVSLRRSGRP